jgi:hypothetical protein
VSEKYRRSFCILFYCQPPLPLRRLRRRVHEVRPLEAPRQLDPPEDQEHQVPVLRKAIRGQVQSEGNVAYLGCFPSFIIRFIY